MAPATPLSTDAPNGAVRLKNKAIKAILAKEVAPSVKLNSTQSLDDSTLIDPCSCETKNKILEVASQHFSHYGYGKTTIADIAKACEMSPGNIYRYYESKLDIAAAIIRSMVEDLVVEMHDKAGKTIKAREKLRVILFGNMRRTYEIIEQNPKMSDLMAVVRKERPEIRRWARKMERKMIAETLKYGKETKEFSVDCINSVARIIQCLVSRFRWSKLATPHVELKRLETELEATFEMITTALGAGCSLRKIMSRHPKTKENPVPDDPAAATAAAAADSPSFVAAAALAAAPASIKTA